MQPDILKSTRHSKIAGDFGETLVLYWLSKHGFECARVDHTGIDLIARNPHTRELMGISVKSRTRMPRRERANVRIAGDNFTKAASACEAFGCVPYFALVIDLGAEIRGYIVPLQRVWDLCGRTTHAYWKMTPTYLEQYDADPLIMRFDLQMQTKQWWKT